MAEDYGSQCKQGIGVDVSTSVTLVQQLTDNCVGVGVSMRVMLLKIAYPVRVEFYRANKTDTKLSRIPLPSNHVNITILS